MRLTADELIERARQRTGLDDLGPGDWRLGFDRLLAAEVDEPDSVERIGAIVVERLVQRLRIEGWYAQHEAPEPVVAPLAIVGLPRTATTAMHHLLALDPQFRYLRSWEVSDPVPPPVLADEHEDPRRPTAVATDDVRHIVSVDGPAEDWPIHAMAFDHAELTLPVPGVAAWWRTRNHGPLFAYLDRVLRLLHSHRPPQRWLLKLPAYLFELPALAAQYPDTTFVWTHRDPVTVMASTCSTVADSRAKRTPASPPGPGFGRELLDHWAEGVRQAMAAREALGEARFVDVVQAELEADPIGVAERALGSSPDGAVADAMGAWAAANRRGSRGAHRYSLAEYGLTEADVTTAFGPYLERFSPLLR